MGTAYTPLTDAERYVLARVRDGEALTWMDRRVLWSVASRTFGGSIGAVILEVETSQARYGDINSSHEGYGVLAEEVAELLDAIRANDGDAIAKEALQVAAVALRLRDAALSNELFRRRSNIA